MTKPIGKILESMSAESGIDYINTHYGNEATRNRILLAEIYKLLVKLEQRQ